MPRRSSLPYHLLQAVHVPKDHPDVVSAGRGARAAATHVAVSHGARPGTLELSGRRVNYYSFGQIDPRLMDPSTYVTFTDPRGVQSVSARLKPVYETSSLTRLPRTFPDMIRRASTWVFYSAGGLRVGVSVSDRTEASMPRTATVASLLRRVGRARLAIG